MRQDILTTATLDRKKGGTLNYKMERGTAGELVFIISGGTWNHADRITAKLRHQEGVDVVIDRVPALLLALLCDLKKGRPSTGTPNSLQEVGEEQTQETVVNTGQAFFVNAFKVPIGHITLADAASELEITVDLAKAFGNDVRIKLANIEPKAGPDFLVQYDMSDDLESTHLLVREVYLCGKKGASFFETPEGELTTVGKDINVMVYADSGAYETDVELLGACTSIDGELSHSVSTLLQVYTDPEPLPTPSVRFKVSGEDKGMAQLLFLKEKMIQKMTSTSTIAQVEHVLRKTDQIEKMGDGIAKAYRHAGAALPAEQVKDVKDKLEAVTPA